MQWQEQEMMDMKMSLFFSTPFTEWMEEIVVSYLVRACQSLAPGQEDLHAEVRSDTFPTSGFT